jgi:hypothetical protein
MALTTEELSFVERKMCVMLFLQLIRLEGTYTISTLRCIHDFNVKAVDDVERNPPLYDRILIDFGKKIRIITVLDWDEQW